jgi:nucleoside-diphosphate-sugar epimerase
MRWRKASLRGCRLIFSRSSMAPPLTSSHSVSGSWSSAAARAGLDVAAFALLAFDLDFDCAPAAGQANPAPTMHARLQYNPLRNREIGRDAMAKQSIRKRMLVTGGAGYIGSHCAVALLEAGCEVLIADNLCNSHAEVVDRIERLTGGRPAFERIDLREARAVNELFARHPIDTVIHFAGLKAVGESTAQPLRYYDNNVVGTLRLLEAMHAHGVRRIVFSSSAAMYGAPDAAPVGEQAPLRPHSPYGHTKLAIENMLLGLAAAESDWWIALLRYFNPVGAHPSGIIGEDPSGVPQNLMPFLTQAVAGRLPELRVFGGDYPTAPPCGTTFMSSTW